jgi:hypothetical protein
MLEITIIFLLNYFIDSEIIEKTHRYETTTRQSANNKNLNKNKKGYILTKN